MECKLYGPAEHAKKKLDGTLRHNLRFYEVQMILESVYERQLGIT